MKELVVILVLVVVIIFIIWINYDNNEKEEKKKGVKQEIGVENLGGSFPDDPEQIRKEFHIVAGKNYIMPKKFNVGMINNPKYVSMNDCNHNVLYPINSVDVDYGSKMPSYCPCMRFIQAP